MLKTREIILFFLTLAKFSNQRIRVKWMLKDLFSFTINDHSHTYQIKDFYTIFFTKLEISSETECDEREVYVIYNKEETILYNRGLSCRFA